MTWAPPAEQDLSAPVHTSTSTLPRRLTLARLGTPAARRRPPLELATLAAHLRALGGLDVRIDDVASGEWTPRDAAERLAGHAPDVLVVWTPLGGASDLMAVLHHLRPLRPGVTVCVAGDAAAERSEELLAPQAADFVLRPGEELGFVDWMRAQRDPRTAPDSFPRGCRGLVWRDTSGALVREATRPLPSDLDREPLPAWDLIDVPRYFGRPGGTAPNRERREWAPIVTSRTCAPGCRICHSSYGRVFRGRGPAGVLEEIDRLVESSGVREIVVEDELPNHDPERLRALAHGLVERERDLVLTFAHPLRGDLIDPRDAPLLAAAGVRQISVLVETTSPRLQRDMKLNVDLEATARAVDALDRAEIATRGVFTIGLPTETAAERAATIRFATRSSFHTVEYRRHGTGEPCAPHAGLIPHAVGPVTDPTRGRRRALLRARFNLPRWWRLARLWSARQLRAWRSRGLRGRGSAAATSRG